DAAYAALSKVQFHALKPEREAQLLEHMEHVTALKSALDTHNATLTEQRNAIPSLTQTEREQLAAVLRDIPAAMTTRERARDALLEALTRDGSISPSVADWALAYSTALAERNGTLPELELRLADALLGYAHAVRTSNPHNLPTDLKEAHGDDNAGKLMLGQLFRDLRQLSRGETEGLRTGNHSTPEALVQGISPPEPQYHRLVGALEHYEAIRTAGGWPTDLPRVEKPLWGRKQTLYKADSRRIPPGLIQTVKARLAAEGFYKGEPDDTWNEGLEAAILHYRRTHQLWDKPQIDYDLLESMRLSVDYRIAQLKVTLQRWRESRVGLDRYYIHVNVPDFHGEVWEDGQRVHRFRVITGDTKRYRKDGRWRFLNATPLFTSRVDTVVFNPSWFVPDGIKRKELDKNLEDNPNWYAENGFEVSVDANGKESVRQKPGWKNALGEVKILFPNRHSVYMHDTPKRYLFKNPIRAYSHGCMRVQDPLKLAQIILEREDPAWTQDKVNNSARGTMENYVRLESLGPNVHIEYFTVRVNDEGETEWLADVYKYDGYRILDDYKLRREGL
ncbi:MAG: L,D-transpeptidase family protein, partial [Myxococcota bacterium]